eukprot:TRINITY_DN40_c0_g1_i3.p1 TRINITY_DN40_c0_g1~~TRINITY_DN40_c0_g1_i3.p1  ORF type:complete len:425 (+),score=95.22 TRINITY_DN40_c0_g1_i3:276-1550(+)
MATDYETAATSLKNRNSPVKVAKVDGTVNRELSTRFKVPGYPTLKFFQNGEPTDYDGDRSANAIVSYIRKKTAVISEPLTTRETLEKFTAMQETNIVAYINPSDVPIWYKVAENPNFDGISFGHVTTNALFDGKLTGTVEIRRNGEIITDSGANEALLAHIHKIRIQHRPRIYAKHWERWLLDEAFPVVDTYGPNVLARAQAKNNDLLVIFIKNPSLIKSDALAIAKRFRGSVVVATSSELNVAENWGASGTRATAVYHPLTKKNSEKVLWDEDNEVSLDTNSLLNFVQQARTGTYSSFIKSEPIPSVQDSPVTVLVGKTLPKAIAGGKDVFIEFYAPWCGHCKNLAPTWDELGEAYKNDDVVIAKIDATANRIPSSIQVQGFPTLIFFNAKKKQFPYTGDRNLEDLKLFVESHRTKSKPKTEL